MLRSSACVGVMLVVVATSVRLAVAQIPNGRTTSGIAFGGTGETIFEHTRASLRDPHFGMRFYLAPKVPGTLSPVSTPGSADADLRAAAPDGRHLFWDVAFGERAPVFGWYDVHPTKSLRHARGFQLNLDAAAFVLLDFFAQSSAVINTDYRIGVSADLRPWWDGWDRLSLSVGLFHQSTHLGDEYTLSARTIQNADAPVANPALPYRANPSFLAFPVTVSADLEWPSKPAWAARLYAGGAVFALSGVPEATRPEGRLGLELRYDTTEDSTGTIAPLSSPPATPSSAKPPSDQSASLSRAATQGLSRFLESTKHFGFGHATPARAQAPPVPGAAARAVRRGARSWIFAYEVLAQRRYHHHPDPAFAGQPVFQLGDGAWFTHHGMAMLLFNLDTERSVSNALAVSLEYLAGRNQHGQLIEYDSVHTAAVALSYYW